MRISDTDILILPGMGNSGPDHWQSRWQARLSTERRVEQDDWDRPTREAWVGRLIEVVHASTRPAIIIAHSLGVSTAVLGADRLKERVIGALLVAPPDADAGAHAGTGTRADAGVGAVARVTLTNTGERPGTEVVQVYLSRRESAVERPVRWLAGFAKVAAEPGETVTVEVALPGRVWAHWATDEGRWTVEPGPYEVHVGGNIADTPLRAVWTM